MLSLVKVRFHTPGLFALCWALLAAAPIMAQAAPKSHRMLAIFAHPDDDVAIGPLLAHYARRGVPVYLAIVTSGQKGTTAHAKIPAGDELAAVREAEAKEAAKEYGVARLFLFGEQDGTLAGMHRRGEIVERLIAIMRELQPSVIVTWGPDGLTGHPDHRAVSNMVTEMFQAWRPRATEDFAPKKLYYVSYPESKFSVVVSPFPRRLGSVADRYITTIVQAGDGVEAAARAERCYKSQHTPEMMKGLNEMIAGVLEGKVYLRLALCQLASKTERESDIFEGIR